MQKPVEAAIAVARAKINVPSQTKLPDEMMRLLLMDILTDYTNQMIMENDDRFLQDIDCKLVYDNEQKDWVVTFGQGDQTVIKEFLPTYLYYTDSTDAARPELRHKIYLTSMADYAADNYERYSDQSVAVFYGNNYDMNSAGMRLRMDMPQDSVDTKDWRLVGKVPFARLLAYTDNLPFPQSHIGLLETELAFRSLDIVEDESEFWQRKYSRLKDALQRELEMKQIMFTRWIQGEIKTRVKAMPAYDYKQGRNRHSRRIVESDGRW